MPAGRGIRPIATNGQLFEFGSAVNYTCKSADLFFEDNRERTHFEVGCTTGGIFQTPAIWPRCVDSKFIVSNGNLKNTTKLKDKS